tara:strand:+ start:8620 stop:11448 length:2829 start_codon:yes stop_codon:yes gene_type:complete
MLNISDAVFNSRLPVPLIKEIRIIPVDQEQEQIKQSNIVVDIVVSTKNANYNNAFNLNVSALMSKKDERYINRPQLLANYAKSSSPIVKNIKIDNLSKNVSEQYYRKDADSTLYSKIISVPFNLETVGNIRHLSILCFTSGISERTDSNIPFDISSRLIETSRPVLENVIRRGTIRRQAVIYKMSNTVAGYGKEGDVWVGPVHYHPNSGLMAEGQHVDKPHPRLETITVPNQKIKDYRTRQVNNFINTRKRQQQSRGYLSKVYYSRSKDGSVKIHTTFDLINYVRDNAQLSHLFESDEGLLSAAELLDIKVYRTFVGNTNYGNYLTPDKIGDSACIDQSQSKRLIGTLSDGDVQVITPNSTTTDNKFLSLLIIDSQIVDESEGLYHYDIEIEMNDNSAKAISSLATQLRDTLVETEYYDLKVNNYDKKVKNYDFNALAREQQLKTDNSWKRSLELYISILRFMFGDSVGRVPVSLIARNMLSFASPYSVTAESLSEFNNILKDFLRILDKNIQKYTAGNLHKNKNFNSKIAGSNPLVKKLKFVSDIKENYANQLTKNNGFDYFGEFIAPSLRGLNQISFQQYELRIDKEVQKYDVPSPNQAGVNKYGFLSPMAILTDTISIEATKNIQFDKSLDLLSANENKSTMSKNFKANPMLATAKFDSMDFLLGQSGVQFQPKLTSLKKIRNSIPGETAEVVDSSEYLSDSSPFVNTGRDARTAISGSELIKFKNIVRENTKFADNPLLKGLVEAKSTSFRPVEIASTELISGSLAATQLQGAPESIQNLNSLEQNINFNSVVRVEYSTGVGDEWLPLNNQSYEAIKNSSAVVVCRVSQQNKALSVENKFSLEGYDQLFVLGNAVERPTNSHPTFDQLIDSIKKDVRKLFIETLNYKSAGGGVMSEYLSSPATLADLSLSSAPRSRRRPRVTATATVAAGTTGGGSSY